MSKAHRLKPRKSKALADVALNFLLGCSEGALASFELARLYEIANLRKELQATLDRMLDQMAQAALAGWFRSQDRNALRHAIENEETPEEWAHRMIRNKGRSEEEIGEDGYSFPLPALEPGAAHVAAAKRYAERNLAEGKCRVCPKPLAHNSVEFCEEHLAKSALATNAKRHCHYPEALNIFTLARRRARTADSRGRWPHSK